MCQCGGTRGLKITSNNSRSELPNQTSAEQDGRHINQTVTLGLACEKLHQR